VLAWEQAGWSVQQMADALTELRVPLPRSERRAPGRWHYAQVRRLLALARIQKEAQVTRPARDDVMSLAERTVKLNKNG
jgi:hypothetical protein